MTSSNRIGFALIERPSTGFIGRKYRTVARVRSFDYNESRFKTFERFLISETSWMADQLSGEARGTSSEGAQEFLKDISQGPFLWLNRKVTSMLLVAFA